MSQRMMLTIAAALTAFILVMGSGLITYMAQTGDQPSATAVPEAATTVTTNIDPTVEALVKERELAYQQALDEANRRLAQANQQLAQQSANSKAAQPGTALSAAQAQTIALNVAPGAKVSKAPELVSYQGTAAYEVVLDRGTVYIDAQSGAILASSVATAAPNVETSSAKSDTISEKKATQIAIDHRGGGTVSAIGLTYDGMVYEIAFTDGYVVFVDSATGQVLQTQQTGPGEREDDDKHENHDEHEEHEG